MKVEKNALAKYAGAFFAPLQRDQERLKKKIKKTHKKVLTERCRYGILQTERVSPMY